MSARQKAASERHHLEGSKVCDGTESKSRRVAAQKAGVRLVSELLLTGTEMQRLLVWLADVAHLSCRLCVTAAQRVRSSATTPLRPSSRVAAISFCMLVGCSTAVCMHSWPAASSTWHSACMAAWWRGSLVSGQPSICSKAARQGEEQGPHCLAQALLLLLATGRS